MQRLFDICLVLNRNFYLLCIAKEVPFSVLPVLGLLLKRVWGAWEPGEMWQQHSFAVAAG